MSIWPGEVHDVVRLVGGEKQRYGTARRSSKDAAEKCQVVLS